MTEPGESGNGKDLPLAAPSTAPTLAKVPRRRSARRSVLTPDMLLTQYVDLVAPDDYTPEAKAALISETRQFTSDVCAMSSINRRADGNAEKLLERHVTDSVRYLRSRRTDAIDSVADWSKWIGFAFLGFFVGQWINVSHEKPIAHGSVAWLVIDGVVAAALLALGIVLNRPWAAFRLRRR